MIQHYWQKWSQYFSIKVALQHLILGVIATVFSLPSQSALPASQHSANIITIASVMVNLHEYQNEQSVQYARFVSDKRSPRLVSDCFVPRDSAQLVAIRLTPDNRIRAGPDTSLFN